MEKKTSRSEYRGENTDMEKEVRISAGIPLDRIRILREVFVVLMNHLIFYPLPSVLFFLFYGDRRSGVFFWMITGMVPVLFYFFRRNIHRFVPLCFAHVLPVLLIGIVMKNVPGRWIYTIVSFFYLIFSLKIRFTDSDFSDRRVKMPAAVAITVIVSLVQMRTVSDTPALSVEMKIFGILLILSFGLSFLITWLEEYINFLIVNRSSTGHIPAKEIFFSGGGLAAGSVAFMVLLLLLTADIGWIRLIAGGLWSVIRSVLMFLLSLRSMAPEMDWEESAGFGDAPGLMQGVEYADEPSRIWQVLAVLLFTAVAVAVFFLFVKLLKSLCKFIKEKMNYRGLKKTQGNPEALFDVRERCTEEDTGEEGVFSLRNVFLRMSPNERIRRLYRQFVLKSRLEKPEVLTAGEVGRMTEKSAAMDIYDKARYSGQECPLSDYRKMKQTVWQKK